MHFTSDNFDIKLPEIEFEHGEIPPYISDYYIPVSAEAEFTAECTINVPLFERLAGIDISRGTDMTNCSVVFSKPYEVQIRKHKKKRINKKWAKRYGYKTIFKKYRLNNVTFHRQKEECPVLGFDISGGMLV